MPTIKTLRIPVRFAGCFALSLVAISAVFMVTACSPTAKPGGQLNSRADQARLFQQKNIGRFELGQTYRVALTFDDGPTAGVTDALLDLLSREKVQATFFILGEHVAGNEAALARMRDEGHVLANHSFSHEKMSEDRYVLEPDRVVREILRTHRALAPFLAPTKQLYFRAPFGSWRAEHAERLNAHPELRPYIGPVYWNHGGDFTLDRNGALDKAADWACWSKKNNVTVADCAAAYFREIVNRQGGVILLHDRDMRTVEMTALLISWLKDEGYGFISLDQIDALKAYATPPEAFETLPLGRLPTD